MFLLFLPIQILCHLQFVIEKHLISWLFRLIKLGLDVNRRHELGWTALQVAVINRNME